MADIEVDQPQLKADAIGFVDALVQVGDAVDTTVIVVGTSGESPIRGALLGSTPHKLLHIANRPVLCVPVAR